VLSDDEINALADEVATTEYNVPELARRRRGRPSMGSKPAEVVPVRLDPELRRAVEERAGIDHTSTSEVIRTALRDYLHVN
jgi:hypothetical protein